MSSIGGKTVLFVQGTLDTPGMVTEPLTRPGVDGVAFREQGSRSKPTEMVSIVDVDDAAGVVAEIAAYKALQGTLVTVVDDRGSTTANVMVIEVQPVGARAIGPSVGGVSTSAGLLLTCRWTLQTTE